MSGTAAVCLNCGRSEQDFPVVVLRLAEKLLGVANIPGAPPCDH